MGIVRPIRGGPPGFTALPKRVVKIALCAALVAAGSTAAHAGPALLPEAQPDFQDPLSRIRPDVPAANAAAAASGLSTGGTFTVIGGPEAGALPTPDRDELTQTVRDQFLGQPGGNPAATGSAANGQAADQSTENLIRALVNTVPGGGSGGGNGRGDQEGDSSIVSSVIDATLIDLISTMLNPKLATDGMVTFSIAGFGEFALLLLQETGGFFIVDMESGQAMKFSEGVRLSNDGRIANRRPGARSDERGSSNALQRLLDILERNVVPIVTSPITLATIVLFSMIWIIWRISARE